MDHFELNSELGNIDIYLLDQILKGRINPEDKILDAGCGEGRNLSYFIKNSFETWGIDRDESAIRMLKMFARSLNPEIDSENFTVGDTAELPYPEESFEYVISSAVLHFSGGKDNFRSQARELFRVLKPGGTLFLRTIIKKGIIDYKELGDGIYELGDGSIRYMLDDEDVDFLITLGFDWLEEPKWVCVNEERSMSVFILTKD